MGLDEGLDAGQVVLQCGEFQIGLVRSLVTVPEPGARLVRVRIVVPDRQLEDARLEDLGSASEGAMRSGSKRTSNDALAGQTSVRPSTPCDSRSLAMAIALKFDSRLMSSVICTTRCSSAPHE